MSQTQKGGNDSTNVQVGSVTIQGVSFSDARQIAVDVMKSELSILTGVAEEAARERISNYADKLINKLKYRPELLNKFRELRTQISVRDAHLLHAKRGCDDIIDLSIDMLIEIISCRGDDFKSVVIDDAIRTVHSLTSGQIDSLSLLVIMRHYNIDSENVDDWCDSMSSLAKPFIETATRSDSQLDYLVGIGCADLEVLNQTFGHYFNMRYGRLSALHFQEEHDKKLSSDDVDKVSRNLRGTTKKKVAVGVLNQHFDEYSPTLSSLQNYFDSTKLAKMNLRVLGRAIGAANIRRKLPDVVISDDIWFVE